jgi:hypothetical protein
MQVIVKEVNVKEVMMQREKVGGVERDRERERERERKREGDCDSLLKPCERSYAGTSKHTNC